MATVSEDQKKAIAAWLEEGLKLSDIQAKLQEKFGLGITYMDLRFLIDDLELSIKDKETPLENKDITNTPAPVEADAELVEENGEESGSGVSIAIHKIQKPGSVVSGSVQFANGNNAEWQIDQMGRLGIIPGADGYKPSQEDIMEFQQALQYELQRAGF